MALGTRSRSMGNELHVNVLGDVMFASSDRAVARAAQRSRGSRVLVCARVADGIGEVHANGRAFMLVS